MDKTLQEQIDILKVTIKSLSDEVYRNNFSSHQDFNKSSNFTSSLKVPHYELVPIVGEVGQIIEVGGVLYICSSPNTFTIV